MGLFLKSRAGILPIIIAVMIVSTLASVSLVMSLTSGLTHKRIIATLDRKEAFYSNEIAAWHSYFRIKGSLTPGSAFTIDNRYVLTLTLAAGS